MEYIMGRNVNNNQSYLNTCVKRKHMFPWCPRTHLGKSISLCKGLWIEKNNVSILRIFSSMADCFKCAVLFTVYQSAGAPSSSRFRLRSPSMAASAAAHGSTSTAGQGRGGCWHTAKVTPKLGVSAKGLCFIRADSCWKDGNFHCP